MADEVMRDRRPLYEAGMRVRITSQGKFHDWHGTILNVRAYQRINGDLVTYLYRIEMDNLVQLSVFEEELVGE